MKEYPTKSDMFNMNTIYDYSSIISADKSANKVIKSRKTFIKESNNKNNNKRLFRTQNK